MICMMKQTNLSKFEFTTFALRKEAKYNLFFFFNIFVLDCELENE